MRLLVTGAAGMLGTDVVAAAAGHDVVALTRADLDITDADAVRAALRDTGRASLVLQSQVAGADGAVAASGRARYVAFARAPETTGAAGSAG
jgi:dTDP-4-dehydrorhamnose reductase